MIKKFSKEIGAHGEVRAVPRPSQDELDRFYAEMYFSSGVSSTYTESYDKDELAQKKLRAAVTVEAICQNFPYNKDEPSLLEVGSGEGFVLAAAAERGLNINGVDYQAAPIEKFNSAIIEHFTATDPTLYLQQSIETGKKYDGIILQNVLEHVRDPEGMLASLRAILNPDGLLLVQIPNDFSAFQSFAMERGKIEVESWFVPPQHLTYWNSDNLKPYFTDQGFEIVDGFTDFPIELFLWGAPTNYSKDPSLGPHAHRGRVEIDLFFARSGLQSYLDLYRSFYRVGFGRNVALVVKML